MKFIIKDFFMSDIDTNLNNTEEQPATKNVRLKCDTDGESLPLAPAGMN